LRFDNQLVNVLKNSSILLSLFLVFNCLRIWIALSLTFLSFSSSPFKDLTYLPRLVLLTKLLLLDTLLATKLAPDLLCFRSGFELITPSLLLLCDLVSSKFSSANFSSIFLMSLLDSCLDWDRLLRADLLERTDLVSLLRSSPLRISALTLLAVSMSFKRALFWDALLNLLLFVLFVLVSSSSFKFSIYLRASSSSNSLSRSWLAWVNLSTFDSENCSSIWSTLISSGLTKISGPKSLIELGSDGFVLLIGRVTLHSPVLRFTP